MDKIINTTLQKSSSKPKLLNSRFGALALLLFLGVLLPGSASAYDGQVAGQVGLIETSAAGNGFGIKLVGSPNLCTGSNPTWGVIGIPYGDSLDSVKLNLAMVTAAKLSGATITVYTYNASDGMCHIWAIDVY